jgi:hypothetical protein
LTHCAKHSTSSTRSACSDITSSKRSAWCDKTSHIVQLRLRKIRARSITNLCPTTLSSPAASAVQPPTYVPTHSLHPQHLRFNHQPMSQHTLCTRSICDLATLTEVYTYSVSNASADTSTHCVRTRVCVASLRLYSYAFHSSSLCACNSID